MLNKTVDGNSQTISLIYNFIQLFKLRLISFKSCKIKNFYWGERGKELSRFFGTQQEIANFKV